MKPRLGAGIVAAQESESMSNGLLFEIVKEVTLGEFARQLSAAFAKDLDADS